MISAIITVGSPIPSPTPRAILSLKFRLPEHGALVALLAALLVGDEFAAVALEGVGEVNEGPVLTNGAGDDVDVLADEKVAAEDVSALLGGLATSGVDGLVDKLAAAVVIVATGVPALTKNAPSVPH